MFKVNFKDIVKEFLKRIRLYRIGVKGKIWKSREINVIFERCV